MKKQIDIRFLVLFLIVALVGAWRIVVATPEMSSWTNFSPVGAMALFAGTYFTSRGKSYLTPVLVLLISDVILMQTLFADYRSGLLYSGWYWTYGAFILMVLVGELLKQGSAFRSVLLGSLIAATVHFLISNFGVWVTDGVNLATGLPYTRDFSGLFNCYVAGIPFFKNILLGNLIFSTLLFGGFELAQRRFPALQLRSNF